MAPRRPGLGSNLFSPASAFAATEVIFNILIDLSILDPRIRH
jgi:hypothetical protein